MASRRPDPRAWGAGLLALLVLVNCGKTTHERSPDAAIGGEAGQPSAPIVPDPSQAFAFGIAAPLDADPPPSPAYACTTQGAIALGISTKPTGRLSPDGLHWAVARSDGVDVIEAPALTSQRLAGRQVDLDTLRWSDDGGRLGYFADGLPMLADGDGRGGRALAITLPDPDDELELPLVEWAATGERVGFVARGVAVTAKRDGSAPRALFRQAARVTITRGLAFSHDGEVAAVVSDSSRELVLVDTSSLDVTATDLSAVTTIQAWARGDAWLLSSTAEARAVLVSRAGDTLPLRGSAAASPTAPEVALSHFGIKLLSLATLDERDLIASDLDTGSLFFRADGRAIQYLASSSVRVVASSDGALLAENPSWGSFGPGEWFAVAKDAHLKLTRLDDPSAEIAVPSSVPVKLPEGGGAWLKDDRFALADERGVHLISLDGTIVDVCPDVTRVDAFQVPRTNPY